MAIDEVLRMADLLQAEEEYPADSRGALLEKFAPFYDQQTGAIGRVVASEREPSGAHQFYFWAAEEARTIDVGHIVVAFSEDAAIIGVVDEPRRFSDLRSFLDDFFDRRLEDALERDQLTLRPEILVFSVQVLATRHLRDDVDSNRPAIAGPVYFATQTAIADALGEPKYDGVAIPALLHTNGNVERDAAGEPVQDERGNVSFQRSPVSLDSAYLLGPEAGHGNWTGQSGLATKTSHVQFLTSAIFQRMQEQGESVAALMFNVKGADLLWMDKPAIPPPGLETAYASARAMGLSQTDLEAYAALGLEPEAFTNLQIFSPFRPGLVPTDATVRIAGTNHSASLNSLRNAPSVSDIVHPVLWQLDTFLWAPHKIFDRADLDDKLLGFIYEIRNDEGLKTMLDLKATFARIDAFFHAEAEDGRTSDSWKGHHRATISKARNRLQNLPNKFAGLLADGAVDYGNTPQVTAAFSDQEVRVVDISQCNSDVQEMLVTRVVNDVWKKAERKELGVDHIIIFVDELNKYAASGSESGLRDTLVDIAARGRHLSVVLFGAQQFRSKVDDEILGNCGTSFYGRVGDEEIMNASYRSLSNTAKAELLGLRKGTLLVRHAHFRAPVFGTFPRPPVIAGAAAQQVYNGTEPAAGTFAGEALYRLMQRLHDPVSKNEVLSACEGLTATEVGEICAKVESSVTRNAHGTARNISTWLIAKNAVRAQHEAVGR